MNNSDNMSAVLRRYDKAESDELNILAGIDETDKQAAKKVLRQYFEEQYFDGIVSVYFLLEMNSDVSILSDKTLKNQILDRSVDGKTYIDRIDDGSSVESIARSDGHRVFIEAQLAAAQRIAHTTHKVLFKRWDATLDSVTRDTHYKLHGTTIPLDDEFETVNGKTIAPGLFGIPAEDCNCRCILDFLAY